MSFSRGKGQARQGRKPIDPLTFPCVVPSSLPLPKQVFEVDERSARKEKAVPSSAPAHVHILSVFPVIGGGDKAAELPDLDKVGRPSVIEEVKQDVLSEVDALEGEDASAWRERMLRPAQRVNFFHALNPVYKWEPAEMALCNVNAAVEPFAEAMSDVNFVISPFSMHLHAGQWEPLFCSLTLYNVGAARRISETFHFHLNEPEMLALMGPDGTAAAGFDSAAKAALFTVKHAHNDIFLVLRIEKVLEGDGDQVTESYIKAGEAAAAGGKASGSSKVDKVKEASQKACRRLAAHRQPLAWAATPVFQDRGHSFAMAKMTSFDALYAQRGAMSDTQLCAKIDEVRDARKKKDKTIPGYCLVNATVVEHKREKNEYVGSFQDKEGPEHGVTFTPGKDMHVMAPMLALAPPETQRPFITYHNDIALRLESLNLEKLKVGIGKSRNVVIYAQVRASDSYPFDNGVDEGALPVIYDRYHPGEFVRTANSQVMYHSKTPTFQDEIRVRLPVALGERHHVLFQIFHVPCQEKKNETDAAEKFIAYGILDLLPNGRLVSDSRNMQLYTGLAPGYCSVSIRRNLPVFDGGKPNFCVTAVPYSSVYPQDGPLHDILATYSAMAPIMPGNDEALAASLKDLTRADISETIRQLPVLLDILLDVVCRGGSLSRPIAFAMLINVVKRVNSRMGAEGSRNNKVLVSYVDYAYDGKMPLHRVLVKLWLSVMHASNKEHVNDVTRASWFLFDLIAKSLTVDLHESDELGDVEARAVHFSKEIIDGLQALTLACIEKIGDRVTLPVTLAKDLNNNLAWFIRSLFAILESKVVFGLIKSYVAKMQENADSVELRFLFYRILVDYEHYVPVNVPVPYEFEEVQRRSRSLSQDATVAASPAPSAPPAPPAKPASMSRPSLPAKPSESGSEPRPPVDELSANNIADSFARESESGADSADVSASADASATPTDADTSASDASSSKSASLASTTSGSSTSSPSSPSAMLIQELCKRHFLAGILLAEVETCLEGSSMDHKSTALMFAAWTLRDLVCKHDHDSRYQDAQRRARVAQMYFPILLILLDHSVANADKAERKALLSCVVYVLLNVDRAFLRSWWRREATSKLLAFWQMMGDCLESFAYVGESVAKEEATQGNSSTAARAISAKSALENMYRDGPGHRTTRSAVPPTASASHERRKSMTPLSTQTLRGGRLTNAGLTHSLDPSARMSLRGSMATDVEMGEHAFESVPQRLLSEGNVHTEVVLLVLDLVEDFCEDFSSEIYADVVAGSDSPPLLRSIALVIQRVHASEMSVRATQVLYAFLRNFCGAHRELLFRRPTATTAKLVKKICRLTVRHCSFVTAPIRSSAVAFLYYFLHSNFAERGSLSPARLHVTIAVSKLIKVDDQFDERPLLNALTVLHDFAASREDEEDAGKFFRLSRVLCDRLLQNVDDTLRTARVKDSDPELLCDLYYRIAIRYSHTPEQHIVWINSLVTFHESMENFAEAAMCMLYLAVYQADFLRIKLPSESGLLAFGLFSSMLNRLNRPDDDTDRELHESLFSVSSLIKTLRKAINYFNRAELFEYAVEAYKPLTALYESTRSFGDLMACHEQLVQAYRCVQDAHQTNSRFLGMYYRVGFYGAKYNPEDELDGKEYIYKEPQLTRLADVCDRLQRMYETKYKCDVVILMDNSIVDRSKLDAEKLYIQITSLDPYHESSDRSRRTSKFDLETNIDCFVFETPFTKGGGARGDISEQYKRKTLLFTVDPFPGMKKRSLVARRTEVVLTPIENSLETLSQRVVVMNAELAQDPPNVKMLQNVLHGSVLAQVNTGAGDIWKTFLMNADAYDAVTVERLRATMFDFLAACKRALALNRTTISTDQLDFHNELVRGYQDMVELMSGSLETVPGKFVSDLFIV